MAITARRYTTLAHNALRTLDVRNPSRAVLTTPLVHSVQHLQRRAFSLNPFGGGDGGQKLRATRIIPYPNRLVYEVITDVASYKHFIPYCQESEVLKYSNPTADGKRWPEEAKLLIGFNGDMSEAFWSRVYCVPESIVETVAGSSETTLSPEEIKHHNPRQPPGQDPVRQGSVMKSLATKWTIRPRDQGTEVSVKIDYEFANPLYSALSSAASPMVADKMIGAFQRRVQAVLDERRKHSGDVKA